MLLVCLAALPTVLFVFYVAQKECNVTLKRMTEDANHLANLALREHTHQIEVARDILLQLGEMLKFKGRYSSAFSDPSFLSTMLQGYPQLANIGILSKDGEVIRSAYPLSSFPNMYDNPAFKRAILSNKVEVGDYIVGPIVAKPILNLAYTIRDSKDAIQWVVFNALELDWLGHLAEMVHLPSEYLIYIVGPNGQILASVGKIAEIPSISNTIKIPDFTSLLNAKGGKILQIKEGDPQRFFVASPTNYTNIAIAVSLPYEKIAQNANRTFYRTLGGLSLLTLFTILSVLVAAELSILRIISNLSNAVRKFGKGNFHIRVPVLKSHGELFELASEFNSMAEALMERHKQLLEAHGRLRILSRHLQVAREEEAKRIARELHDEIGQVLTIVKIDLTTLQRECVECRQHSNIRAPGVEGGILALKKSIDDAVRFVRRISSDLRPVVLDRLGLSAALEWQAREFEMRTHIQTRFEAGNVDEIIEENISTTLFRITQEALTNIVRHARATKAYILLTENTHEYFLSISDNGKGIDSNLLYKLKTPGIIGMQERTNLVNGKLSIAGKPDQGTTITVQIPKNQPNRDHYEHITC